MELWKLRGKDRRVIVRTIEGLLEEAERGGRAPADVTDRYRTDTARKNYREVCEISETYALSYLKEVLPGKEGSLTALHEEELHWYDG